MITEAIIIGGMLIYCIGLSFSLAEMLDRDVSPLLAILLSMIPIFNLIYPIIVGVDFKDEKEKMFKKK